ncbi:RimJ/RimL family protein N-acetyltransferase [Roseibium hamelinense]|uniref:RimJ/RimL family protein N-acetyltransferase n=1 Tax=Roseibium hamelinense TaxID=150831 RepID=A0A562T0R8_9HYPH|nr:GNAT family N-acetyltransferase [Roseibium hamelinense]MTI43779.1 N-acetyltransferase [Roseibium hamelinense]TWI87141.1 RimJ/RimL family protein N-acetyltransferase [Roseibium hamelinense]
MTLPYLKTRRLVLRPLNENDAEAIAELGGKDFDVARWLTGTSWPYIEGEAEAFVSSLMQTDPFESEAVFAVTLGGVFIGTVAIEAPGDLVELPETPTLGYWLGRAFQGNGYASEAVEAVLDWAFATYETQTIAARAFESNTRSRAVLRKMGFKPHSMTDRFVKALDQRVANVVVRLEKQDFERRSFAA